MYCTNCGTQIDDDSLFCPNCGARQSAPVPPVTEEMPVPPAAETPAEAFDPEPAAPKKKLSKGALIGILAGAAAVILLVVLLIVLLGGGSNGGSSPESTVTAYFESAISGDFEKTVSYSMPDDVRKALLQKSGMTESEYRSMIKRASQQYSMYLELYPDGAAMKRSFRCKVLSVESVDREEIYEIDEWYHDKFGVPFGYVEDAAEVTFAVSYTDASGQTESQRDDVNVLKINGRWYIDLDSEYSLNSIGMGIDLIP
jgi:hypothetical protein